MVNKWEIYFSNLDPVVGCEQKGIRPVLVISTDSVNHKLPVSTVLPLSAVDQGEKIYPTEVLLETEITGLPKQSVVMVQQIRTISDNRLIKLVGSITNIKIRKKILKACRNYFDL